MSRARLENLLRGYGHLELVFGRQHISSNIALSVVSTPLEHLRHCTENNQHVLIFEMNKSQESFDKPSAKQIGSTLTEDSTQTRGELVLVA